MNCNEIAELKKMMLVMPILGNMKRNWKTNERRISNMFVSTTSKIKQRSKTPTSRNRESSRRTPPQSSKTRRLGLGVCKNIPPTPIRGMLELKRRHKFVWTTPNS